MWSLKRNGSPGLQHAKCSRPTRLPEVDLFRSKPNQVLVPILVGDPDPDFHVCVGTADSTFDWLFEEETFGQKRRSDVLDILLRYSGSVKVVPPSPDRSYDGIDLPFGRPAG